MDKILLKGVNRFFHDNITLEKSDLTMSIHSGNKHRDYFFINIFY